MFSKVKTQTTIFLIGQNNLYFPNQAENPNDIRLITVLFDGAGID